MSRHSKDITSAGAPGGCEGRLASDCVFIEKGACNSTAKFRKSRRIGNCVKMAVVIPMSPKNAKATPPIMTQMALPVCEDKGFQCLVAIQEGQHIKSPEPQGEGSHVRRKFVGGARH